MFEIHEVSAAPHFPEPLKPGAPTARPESVIAVLASADQNYNVWIRLERFEGTDDGQVILRAHWIVSTADSSAPIASRTVDLRQHGWKPGNYPGLVRLLNEEIAEMSRQIARAIP